MSSGYGTIRIIGVEGAVQAAAQELCSMVANYKGDLGEFDIEIDIDYSDDWNDGWVSTPDKEISFEHCGRPAYWEGEDVFCNKCNAKMGEDE